MLVLQRIQHAVICVNQYKDTAIDQFNSVQENNVEIDKYHLWNEWPLVPATISKK